MSTHDRVSEHQSVCILEPFGQAGNIDGGMYFTLPNGSDLSAIHLSATSYSQAKSIVQMSNGCSVSGGERDVIRLMQFDGADSFGQALDIAERIASILGIEVVPHDQIDLLVQNFFPHSPAELTEAC